MHILREDRLKSVSAGVYQAFIYPAIGCGMSTGITYIKNPDSSARDLGRSCLKGAIHGMNPGFNIIGRVIIDPRSRYAAGIAYSLIATDVASYIIPSVGDSSQYNDMCLISFGSD